MAAFFVATSRIKDPKKLAEYGAKAGATFAPFGGELVVRGKTGDVLTGASDHQTVAVVRFPDTAAVKAWYQSSDYRALIPLRDEAVDMTMVSYEEPV